MAEPRIASLEVFRLDALHENRHQLIDIYRALGRIYSGKFKAESTRSDWYRATIYLSKALDLRTAHETGSSASGLLADFGVHLLQLEIVARNGDLTEEMRELRLLAGTRLEESLQCQADNVSALYTLSWLRFNERRFDEAFALSEKLVRAIEAGGDPLYEATALYNRACYRLALELTPKNEELALNDLRRSHDSAQRTGQLGAWQALARKDVDLEPLRRSHLAELEALFGEH